MTGHLKQQKHRRTQVDLSEFGMGMKSAACWFSDLWTVRTKALGETTEKTVHFNMKKIFEEKD